MVSVICFVNLNQNISSRQYPLFYIQLISPNGKVLKENNDFLY